MEQFEPRIVAFFCNWCTYGAADLAGVGRMQYPPNFRVVRLPCTGGLDARYVLQAFRRGADGVWISGCHPGDCHYISGNLHARRRFALLKNLLEYVGLEPGRVLFSWISSAEAEAFRRTATEVVETVRGLGPNTRLVKKIEEGAGPC
ncbi:MAG: hydrogenase iron-sulfur subunit [Deltaproteobacteria bacterium]|nr:hydrogenase iron-sulfur subunit [Deltaproteobacteria bacterium]